MSAILPTSGLGHTQAARRGSSFPAWLREPLLHFILLGGALFAIDHYLFAHTADPKTIVVSADVDAQARKLFADSRGRQPNAEELTALRRVWLDNEILYREGLALQVDKGDDAIRDRVIFKALSIVEANLKPPAIDEQGLRFWFESHRAKYDEPARFDFQEAVMSGDTSEAAVTAFVELLNTGTPGDAKAGLRVFKDRPRGNLSESYGAEFVKKLEASPSGEWRAFPTREGWRAIHLDAITAPKPADFAHVQNEVQQDWTDATMAEQRTAAVRALGNKYRIVEPAAKK